MKAPKGSESSKLVSGSAAKGSTMLGLVCVMFVGLISGSTTGSEAAKRSTVEEAEEEMAGWDPKRSTSICTIVKPIHKCRLKKEKKEIYPSIIQSTEK